MQCNLGLTRGLDADSLESYICPLLSGALKGFVFPKLGKMDPFFKEQKWVQLMPSVMKRTLSFA